MDDKIEKIMALRPCAWASVHLERYPTFEEARKKCDRADWMLWLAVMLGVETKTTLKVLTLCLLKIEHLTEGEDTKHIFDTVLQYCKGGIDLPELKDVIMDTPSANLIKRNTRSGKSAALTVKKFTGLCLTLASPEGTPYLAVSHSKVIENIELTIECYSRECSGTWAVEREDIRDIRQSMCDICREHLTEPILAKLKTL